MKKVKHNITLNNLSNTKRLRRTTSLSFVDRLPTYFGWYCRHSSWICDQLTLSLECWTLHPLLLLLSHWLRYLQSFLRPLLFCRGFVLLQIHYFLSFGCISWLFGLSFCMEMLFRRCRPLRLNWPQLQWFQMLLSVGFYPENSANTLYYYVINLQASKGFKRLQKGVKWCYDDTIHNDGRCRWRLKKKKDAALFFFSTCLSTVRLQQ